MKRRLTLGFHSVGPFKMVPLIVIADGCIDRNEASTFCERDICGVVVINPNRFADQLQVVWRRRLFPVAFSKKKLAAGAYKSG